MKTKFQYLLWLLAFVPLAFISCDDDEEMIVEDATIETSVDFVNFNKDGGEQSLSIMTNAAKWVASSPVEGTWLTLTVNGTQLGVKAAANTTDAERKSYILINAGNTAAKIEVMQSAGDVALFLTAENVEFTKNGGEKRIDVIGTQSFEVEKENASDWLVLDYVQGASFFTVSAAAYTGNEPRTGKVIVTSGTTVKELEVTQIGEELILLPFFAKEGEAGMLAMMNFEEARGSKIMQFPDALFNQAYYYVTTNPEFPQIGYLADLMGNYTQAVTATTNLDLEEEVYQAIEAKGFTGTGGVYTHAEYPYTVNVTIDAEGIVIESVYTPVQDKVYPTFAALPLLPQMGMTGFEPIVHAGTLEDDVKPWEANNGGIFTPEESDLVENMYAVFKLSSEVMATGALERGYWLEDDANTLSSARIIYNKIDLVYWTPDNNTYYLTKEFNKLMSDNGFVFFTTQDRFKMYVKPDPQGRGFMDVLGVQMVQFTDAFDGQVVLDFQTFKNEDLVSSSLSSIITNKDKLIKFMISLSKQIKENQERDTYKVAK